MILISCLDGAIQSSNIYLATYTRDGGYAKTLIPRSSFTGYTYILMRALHYGMYPGFILVPFENFNKTDFSFMYHRGYGGQIWITMKFIQCLIQTPTHQSYQDPMSGLGDETHRHDFP